MLLDCQVRHLFLTKCFHVLWCQCYACQHFGMTNHPSNHVLPSHSQKSLGSMKQLYGEIQSEPYCQRHTPECWLHWNLLPRYANHGKIVKWPAWEISRLFSSLSLSFQSQPLLHWRYWNLKFQCAKGNAVNWIMQLNHALICFCGNWWLASARHLFFFVFWIYICCRQPAAKHWRHWPPSTCWCSLQVRSHFFPSSCLYTRWEVSCLPVYQLACPASPLNKLCESTTPKGQWWLSRGWNRICLSEHQPTWYGPCNQPWLLLWHCLYRVGYF